MALDIEAFTPGMDSMHAHTALGMDAMDGAGQRFEAS